jgi:Holliday junction DNA helicase RuvB
MPRPVPRFFDFVGQRKLVDVLCRQLAGAMARKEPFPHTLFLGPSGVGKSLLARMLVKEYGTNLIEGMGYDDHVALSRKLSLLGLNDFLFIDECHRLGPLQQELLCEAIDRKSIPAPGGKGSERETEGDKRIALPPWSLALATDQPGRLLDALLKRVVLPVYFDYYPARELKEVVADLATRSNILVSPQAAGLVARVACGLPRKAKLLLQNLRLFHPDAETKQLGIEHVREFLGAIGTDQTGLGPMEVRYLEAVADLGGASLESIALVIGTDKTFVRRQIEAPLVRRALVTIAPGGRRLTPSGQKWVEEHRTSHPEPPTETDEDDQD